MKVTLILLLVLIFCSAYIYFFYSTRYVSFEGRKLSYSAGIQYYDSGQAKIHVFGISLRQDKGIPADTALPDPSKISGQNRFDKTPLKSQIIAYRALQNFVYFFGLSDIIILTILLVLLFQWIRDKTSTNSAEQNENAD